MYRKCQLTRAVTRAECAWLTRDYDKGETVHPWPGYDYGACYPSGKAVTEVPGVWPYALQVFGKVEKE